MTAGGAGAFLDSLTVERLPPGFDPAGFDCGEKDLTDYLTDGTAAADEATAFSCCYVVRTDAGDLVGYFAILADSIRLSGKERPVGVRYSTAPAVKVGRMGVDRAFRGRGVGVWILDYVVGFARTLADNLGVRYVTLDALAKDSLVRWYESYGFVRNKGESDRRDAVLKFFHRFKPGQAPLHVSMRFDILLRDELAPGAPPEAPAAL